MVRREWLRSVLLLLRIRLPLRQAVRRRRRVRTPLVAQVPFLGLIQWVSDRRLSEWGGLLCARLERIDQGW